MRSPAFRQTPLRKSSSHHRQPRWNPPYFAVVAIAAAALGLYAIYSTFTDQSITQPSAVTQGSILPSQAAQRAGTTEVVCGQIASSREIASGHFINFDRPYPQPDHERRDLAQEVGEIGAMSGDTLCIRGHIQMYDGKPMIEIADRAQIIR